MPKYTFICEECKKRTEINCSYEEKKEKEKNLRCNFCKSKKIYQKFEIRILSGDSSQTSNDNFQGCCNGNSCGCN